LARSKRSKRKSRAVGFLFLAGLTLLIAGFIARREIPGLIRHSRPRLHLPDRGDSGQAQGLAAGLEKLHSPPDSAVHADCTTQSNGSGEQITGSERRALNDLIKEKSR
jgi:hypothetical protein